MSNQTISKPGHSPMHKLMHKLMHNPLQNIKKPGIEKKSQGFTLIEVLITVVIVSILASIAVPAYKNYIKTSRRTDAIKAITIAANLLENCKNNSASRDYAGCLPVDGSGNVQGLDTKYYDVKVTVTALDASHPNLAYVLVAKPKASSTQNEDTKCGEFRLNQVGQYTSYEKGGSIPSTGCWKE